MLIKSTRLSVLQDGEMRARVQRCRRRWRTAGRFFFAGNCDLESGVEH
jgi:hypothetical protein